MLRTALVLLVVGAVSYAIWLSRPALRIEFLVNHAFVAGASRTS